MPSGEIARRVRERLERSRGEPVGQQIVEVVWEAVIEGGLQVGQRLPTSRQLAVELGVSPRTVERAYEGLERLGVTATRAGEGTYVSLSPPPEAERARWRELEALCRATMERARELGFGVEEVLETLAEYRYGESPRGRLD